MWGTASMLYSGVVEAAAGMILGCVVFSVANRLQKEEELEVTLYSLKQEVIKIQCAINAARGRRITDQKLLQWLAKLIDAEYLGGYYHRTFKNRNSLPLMIESEGTDNLAIRPVKRRRTIRTLLFGDEEHMKLHDVLKTLKSIDICAFLLMVNAQPERPMKTYLYMEHNRLFNRDKERQQVMNFLFEPNKACENNVSILSIVGSEGIGKTSLALHCFYDTKVQNHFSLKIYVGSSFISYSCICDFPVTLKKILEQCKNTCTINYDENTLLAMLKRKLTSERFLLVLDQVGDVDSMCWHALWHCLNCGRSHLHQFIKSPDYSTLSIVGDFCLC